MREGRRKEKGLASVELDLFSETTHPSSQSYCHFPDLFHWIKAPSIWSHGTIQLSSQQLPQFQFHIYLCDFLSNSLLPFLWAETRMAWAHHFTGSVDQYQKYSRYIINIYPKNELFFSVSHYIFITTHLF